MSANGALAAEQSRKARDTYIDALRGIGIVLVVLGHSIGGLLAADMFSYPSYARHVFYGIYLFHMPLFFFLSGLFVKKRIERDAMSFSMSLLTRLAWPCILWSTIQLFVIDLAGSSVNVPGQISFESWVSIFWNPPSQFWFLKVLLIFNASALVAARYGKSVWLLVAASVAVFSQSIATETFQVLGVCIPFALFYAVGFLSTDQGFLHAVGQICRKIGAKQISIISACVFAASATGLWRRGVDYSSPAALGCQVLGVVMTLAFIHLAGPKPSQFLAWLGRRSMPIFLLHVFVVAGVRIAFRKLLHFESGESIVFIATTLGLALPSFAFAAAQKLKLTRALGFS